MNEPQYTQLDIDLAQIMRTLFQLNLRNLLAEESRLNALAQHANIPAERVPAIREALTRTSSAGLSS